MPKGKEERSERRKGVCVKREREKREREEKGVAVVLKTEAAGPCSNDRRLRRAFAPTTDAASYVSL